MLLFVFHVWLPRVYIFRALAGSDFSVLTSQRPSTHVCAKFSGLFVSMPSRKKAGGEYYDIFHPITAEARNILQATVLEAYEKGGTTKEASAD